jgi:hypothetical protein
MELREVGRQIHRQLTHHRLRTHRMTKEDFPLRKVRRSKYLGYSFGYRDQFGLITFNFAKPLTIDHFDQFDITVNFVCFP